MHLQAIEQSLEQLVAELDALRAATWEEALTAISAGAPSTDVGTIERVDEMLDVAGYSITRARTWLKHYVRATEQDVPVAERLRRVVSLNGADGD